MIPKLLPSTLRTKVWAREWCQWTHRGAWAADVVTWKQARITSCKFMPETRRQRDLFFRNTVRVATSPSPPQTSNKQRFPLTRDTIMNPLELVHFQKELRLIKPENVPNALSIYTISNRMKEWLASMQRWQIALFSTPRWWSKEFVGAELWATSQ